MECNLHLLDGLILPADTEITSFGIQRDAAGITIVDFSEWLTIRTGPANSTPTLHSFEVQS